jgi:NDP-sugar pyrophosphorylase family protein
VNASVFAPLSPDEPANTVSGIYRAMLERQPGAVRALKATAAFFDIGTAADYLETCLAIGRAEGFGDVLAGRGAAIHAGARVSRSVLWDDVEVAEGAALDECVVADGVRIPPGTRLSRRVVVPRGRREPGAGAERVGDLLVTPLDANRRRAS